MSVTDDLEHQLNKNDSKWISEEKAWEILKAEPDDCRSFFDHVEIAMDGGLSEIGKKEELWYNTRYISSSIVIFFVVYNVFFLVFQDIEAIMEPPQPYEHFLLTHTIVQKFGFSISAPQKLVSGVELTILFMLVLVAMRYVLLLSCEKGFRKWQAVAHLSWFTIPNLSCFSAIKVLQFVTPQQLSYDLNYLLWYEPPRTKNIKLVLWFFRTPVAWMIGLDAFLIKVRQANVFLMDRNCSLHDILGTIILMNQILGVVQVGKTIRNRLYRFVFAGEDGIMTQQEQVRQDVWEAMTAEKIYQEYPFLKASALMLSWCDDDFQMMALNDKEVQQGAGHQAQGQEQRPRKRFGRRAKAAKQALQNAFTRVKTRVFEHSKLGR